MVLDAKNWSPRKKLVFYPLMVLGGVLLYVGLPALFGGAFMLLSLAGEWLLSGTWYTVSQVVAMVAAVLTALVLSVLVRRPRDEEHFLAGLAVLGVFASLVLITGRNFYVPGVDPPEGKENVGYEMAGFTLLDSIPVLEVPGTLGLSAPADPVAGASIAFRIGLLAIRVVVALVAIGIVVDLWENLKSWWRPAQDDDSTEAA